MNRERVRLRVRCFADLAAVSPSLAVVAVDVSLVVARREELAVVDTHRFDSLAVGQRKRRPFLISLVPEESGRLVQRAGMQLASKDREAADALGLWELPAIGPTIVAVVSKDATAEIRIFRFLQCRSAEPILRHADVQLPIEFCERRHRVARSRTAAVNPLLPAAEAVHMPGLILALLASSREELAVEDRQSFDKHPVADLSVISPFRFEPILVDAEMQSPRVGLAGGDRVRFQAQIPAEAFPCIELAEQIAGHVIETLVRVQPQRHGEVFRSKLERGMNWHFQPIITAVELHTVCCREHQLAAVRFRVQAERPDILRVLSQRPMSNGLIGG